MSDYWAQTHTVFYYSWEELAVTAPQNIAVSEPLPTLGPRFTICWRLVGGGAKEEWEISPSG